MAGHDASKDSDPIARAIARAHGVLPDQGPIGVFIHHNTLHAFQHLTFHEAVPAGASALGAKPYLYLSQFREAYAAGRVEDVDLDAEIGAELGAHAAEPAVLGLTRAALWRAICLAPLELDDGAGVWFSVDQHSSPVAADAALYRACVARAEKTPGPPRPVAPPRRHRDALVALGGRDIDEAIHAELVRLCAGFLDQGQALATLPEREHGFLAAVTALHESGAPVAHPCRPADADLIDGKKTGKDARALIGAALAALGVEGDESCHDVVLATALALPGWAGMFSRFERFPADDQAHLRVRLEDFVAVRLSYERRAVERAAAELGVPVAWAALRALLPTEQPADARIDGLWLWVAARAAGLDAAAVAALDDVALQTLWAERAGCGEIARRRVWHEAYERRYRRQILDAVAALRPLAPPEPPAPSAQFVFCIDEREESVRRALEEQAPDLETFGAAGFFGVAIDYQGLYDRVPAPHAPVVVIPGHEVHERPVFTARAWAELRRKLRAGLHAVERATTQKSRGLLGGATASLLLGPLAGAVATARVMAPRLSLVLRDTAERWLAPVPATQLMSLRLATGPQNGIKKPLGFSLDEAADRVTGTLKNIGMTSRFAPIVVFLGHGSTSLNNPHESAHDCGACGGRRGGANARLFAELANRPDVRAAVKQRGVEIPHDTWFVGGLHDTADDAVRLYDLERVPAHAQPHLAHATAALEKARRWSAHERCRRFHNAPLGIGADAALAHVEGRASHLGQPRPEYGHCTNAIAFVGRRQLTRGLFLDRRPFLISYDPTQDKSDAILERILAAVGPVGAGISLEYYFSSVDNEVFGCGTKLPHNVTGLVGVMNGHQGDLRTGLPLQMVEIHEPMRLVLIVESTPEALLGIAGRQAEVRELVVNRWVQLISVDPHTGAMHFFDKQSPAGGAGFVPYQPAAVDLPRVERSPDWYQKTRAHLPPALVNSALVAQPVPHEKAEAA